jgi:hypothetical protein
MFKWIMRLLSAAVVAVVVFGLWARKHYDSTSSPPTASSPSTAANNAPPSRAGPPVTTCGDSLLREGGIGKLRIGVSVDSIKSQCRVVKDTNTVDPGAKGMTSDRPTRRITVAFPQGSVEGEIVDERVWRINVTSPAFRTTDSLGVGSTIPELLRNDQAGGAYGEEGLYVISRNHCGLSYHMYGRIPPPGNRHWDNKALSALPASLKVGQVSIVRCNPRPVHGE